MQTILPFLRWAGGKRWIAPRFASVVRRVLQGRFIEPFLGSGAMFFAVAPKRAIISDLNEELINAYKQVKYNPSEIEHTLSKIAVTKRMYYRMRDSKPDSNQDRAIRFIYLNRTCFGGIHRTNQGGVFNVPFGGGDRTPEVVYRNHLLKSAARLIARRGVRLFAGDFENVVDQAQEGDVVFCDPTYRSAGRGRFDRYGPVIFSWSDQIRLANACSRAYDRGVVVIAMNVWDHDIVSLYKGRLLLHVMRSTSIRNQAKKQNRQNELIAILDPLKRDAIWDGLRMKIAEAIPISEQLLLKGAA